MINSTETLLQAIEIEFPLALRIESLPELLNPRIPRVLALRDFHG